MMNQPPAPTPDDPHDSDQAPATYQVVGVNTGNSPTEHVVATFDKRHKAEEFAQFLDQAGTYHRVEVVTARAQPAALPDDADVPRKPKQRICPSCGQRYSRRRMHCPHCRTENDLVRDGIPVEALEPRRAVRLVGAKWLAVGGVIALACCWWLSTLDTGQGRVRTVFRAPFFSVVEGPEEAIRALQIAQVLQYVLLAGFCVCAKGWAEVLSGVRASTIVKLNPSVGWPEVKCWLWFWAGVGAAVATVGVIVALLQLL
jgi:hypothetical protein